MSTMKLLRLFSILITALGLVFASSAVFAYDYEEERENIEESYDEPLGGGPDYQTEQEEIQRQNMQRQEMFRQQQMQTGPSLGWTITRSALLGAVLGAAIGTGGYLISDQDWDPWVIAYSAGGGLVVGTVVGIVEGTSRRETRMPVASLEWIERDMPKAVQVQLFKTKF